MSEIKPAMTPEEWALGVNDALDGCIDWDIGIVDVRLGLYQGRTTLEDRHILAALALHGQPFGFSWEMVDAIRSLLEEHRGDSYHPLPEPELALVEAAADRIAALLPPRGP